MTGPSDASSGPEMLIVGPLGAVSSSAPVIRIEGLRESVGSSSGPEKLTVGAAALVFSSAGDIAIDGANDAKDAGPVGSSSSSLLKLKEGIGGAAFGGGEKILGIEEASAVADGGIVLGSRGDSTEMVGAIG